MDDDDIVIGCLVTFVGVLIVGFLLFLGTLAVDGFVYDRGSFAAQTACEVHQGIPRTEGGVSRCVRCESDGAESSSTTRRLANAGSERLSERISTAGIPGDSGSAVTGPSSSGDLAPGRLADADGGDASTEREQCSGEQRQQPEDCGTLHDTGTGALHSIWRDVDWLFCRDGKWRPVSPKPQPLVDGSAASLGRVRPEVVAQIEEEINAWAMEGQIDREQALRELLGYLGAQAERCWTAGRVPRLHEAPFLLAFVRQLAAEGWRVAQYLPLSCEEVVEASVRGVWRNEESPSTPHQHRLEGQPSEECADPLPVLSSLLARHALAAWDDAYAAYAEVGFPLAHNARSRVGRLRGYGNAINATAAETFIRAYDETCECAA